MKIKLLSILVFAALLAACRGIGNPQPTPPSPKEITVEEIRAEPKIESPYEPDFQPGPCPFQLDGEIHQQFKPDCGFLVVPEDRTNPGSNLVKLAVAWFHQPNPQPDDLQVVFIDGGPGISTLKSLPYSITKFLPLINEHDVIFYDQRGVGLSQPALDCPETDDYIRESLENELTSEETISRQLEFFDECRARLVDQGIQLDSPSSFKEDNSYGMEKSFNGVP